MMVQTVVNDFMPTHILEVISACCRNDTESLSNPHIFVSTPLQKVIPVQAITKTDIFTTKFTLI
jgi:hypothetical protein